MKKEEQKFVQFQQIQKQVEFYSKHLEELTLKIAEFKQLKKDLEKLKDVKSGSEILVPFAQGVYLKAKLDNTERFIANLSGEVCAEKSFEQVKELIDQQIIEVRAVETELSIRIEQAGKQMETVLKDLKNVQKAS